MSTLTVARKGDRIAMASDALTTFEDTRLPPGNDAAPEKIFRLGDALVGVVGYTAHYLVLQAALEDLRGADFTSRRGIFETFRALHPVLKDEFFLQPEAEEGDPYESSQASVLIASPQGIFGVYDMREVHEYQKYWAMGSGMSFAIGAMWAAYDGDLDARGLAELGVHAGAEFDRSSALPAFAHEIEVVPLPSNGAPHPRPRPKRPAPSARRGRA